MAALAIALAAISLSASATSISAAAAAAAAAAEMSAATVVRVVDGDTVDVRLADGAVERVRLIGINTPETVDPRQPVQCFGREASRRAGELLSGQSVGVELDPSQGQRDAYRRRLAHLWLPDGRNFAEVMIGEGFGHAYTYRTPSAYEDAFRAARAGAQAQGLGLWAADTCAGPSQLTDLDEDYSPAPAPPAAAAPAGSTQRYDPLGPDRDCGAFRTHAEAQAFFDEARRVSNQRDRHRLDADNDGIACETLP